MPGEGVTLPRIAVDRRICFAGKCCLDLSLRRLRDKLILFPQMHEQRRMKILDLTQVFLGVTAMIGDGGIDPAAHGREKRHQGAKAIPLDGNLTRTFRQFRDGAQGVSNISDAGVAIVRLIKAKAMLPVGLGSDVKVNARLLTLEQIGCDGDIALPGQFVTGLANVSVDAEKLLQNYDGWRG